MAYSNAHGISKNSWEGDVLMAKLGNGAVRQRGLGDWLFNYIETELTNLLGAQSSMQYLVGVVLMLMWMLLSILLLFRVSRRTSSANSTINRILSSKIVTSLRSIPLTIHIIILLILGASLAILSESLAIFSIGFLAVILIYYGLITFKQCKQWFLLVAGIVLLAYAMIQSKMLDSLIVVNSPMILNLISYSSIAAIILLLINHFVYRPKCNLDSFSGEGELKNLFEI